MASSSRSPTRAAKAAERSASAIKGAAPISDDEQVWPRTWRAWWARSRARGRGGAGLRHRLARPRLPRRPLWRRRTPCSPRTTRASSARPARHRQRGDAGDQRDRDDGARRAEYAEEKELGLYAQPSRDRRRGRRPEGARPLGPAASAAAAAASAAAAAVRTLPRRPGRWRRSAGGRFEPTVVRGRRLPFEQRIEAPSCGNRRARRSHRTRAFTTSASSRERALRARDRAAGSTKPLLPLARTAADEEADSGGAPRVRSRRPTGFPERWAACTPPAGSAVLAEHPAAPPSSLRTTRQPRVVRPGRRRAHRRRLCRSSRVRRRRSARPEQCAHREGVWDHGPSKVPLGKS